MIDVSRIQEYSMKGARKIPLRENLAQGFRLAHIPNQDVHRPAAVPMAQMVKINGEWRPL